MEINPKLYVEFVCEDLWDDHDPAMQMIAKMRDNKDGTATLQICLPIFVALEEAARNNIVSHAVNLYLGHVKAIVEAEMKAEASPEADTSWAEGVSTDVAN